MKSHGFKMSFTRWVKNELSLNSFIPSYDLGATIDGTSTTSSLLDAIKRQLWSTCIDNPLLSSYQPLVHKPSSPPLQPTSTAIIENLLEKFLVNEFLDSDQCRTLCICSKFTPQHLLIVRLLTHMNSSAGIHETGRTLHFLFGFLLLRRRSSSRCLVEQGLPYLFNIKSNEFMLEPHVYSMSLLMIVLLTSELHSNTDQVDGLFQVPPWSILSPDDQSSPSHPMAKARLRWSNDDRSVADAYHQLLDNASEELFSSETLRPVNYFIGWFQTILWMFSRTATSLQPFVKSRLVRRRPNTVSQGFSVHF